MIDEGRIQRIEEKVDSVKDAVTEVKLQIGEIRTDVSVNMKAHMRKVEEHIAGDKKIISELVPVLAKLPDIVEMAEEYHFQKQFKRKLLKTVSIIATVVGVAVGILKVL